MKITPLQQYAILGVIAFLGIGFLFYQFLLKPINNEIKTLQTTRDQKKKDLEEAKRIVAKYVEFKKRADSIQRELEWIQNRIPKSIERAKLLEAASFLQNRSGVFFTGLQFITGAVASKDGSYSEVSMNIRFATDFKGLLNFLYQVSVSNLFMTIRDLTVTPSTDAEHQNVTLTASMVLSGIQAKQ